MTKERFASHLKEYSEVHGKVHELFIMKCCRILVPKEEVEDKCKITTPYPYKRTLIFQAIDRLTPSPGVRNRSEVVELQLATYRDQLNQIQPHLALLGF